MLLRNRASQIDDGNFKSHDRIGNSPVFDPRDNAIKLTSMKQVRHLILEPSF
jgi:hypothetical protein